VGRRLALVALVAIGCALATAPREARATTCTIPYIFTNGTTINAAPFNSNFTALQTCGNNIDNTNIGSAGIYASQVIPLTAAEATFGGALGYTFTTTLTSSVAAGSADALAWQNYTSSTTGIFASSATVTTVAATAMGIAQNGASNLLALDNSGDVGILGASDAAGGFQVPGTGPACIVLGNGQVSTSCPSFNNDATGGALFGIPATSSFGFRWFNDAVGPGLTGLMLLGTTGGLSVTKPGAAVIAPVAPVYTNAGAAVATSFHGATGTCSFTGFSSTCTPVALSGAAVFATTTPACNASFANVATPIYAYASTVSQIIIATTAGGNASGLATYICWGP
jgi:hypothetical protein